MDVKQPQDAAGIETRLTAPTIPEAKPAGGLGRHLGALGVSGYGLFVRLRDKLFSLGVAGSFHAFGRRSVLQTPIRLKNSSRIAVGSGVFVGGGSWLQVLDEYTGDGPALVIGDGTSVVGRCVLSAAASVRLGANVLLARNVYVSDHSHRFDDTTLPVLAQGIANVAPVEIGDGAWLAENVVVLPGVRIGRGSVIGANSVVADDVPDYCVAVGQPARIIRRFGPDQSS
jgi:acetyltransferase-like isoleucine patch superfamily enzyme